MKTENDRRHKLRKALGKLTRAQELISVVLVEAVREIPSKDLDDWNPDFGIEITLSIQDLKDLNDCLQPSKRVFKPFVKKPKTERLYKTKTPVV